MINSELLKKVAQKVDDLISWPEILKKPVLGNVLELADNYIFPFGLAALNEKWGDKIPIQYVDEVEAALGCFLEEDWDGILAVLPEGLDQAIDIKALPDELESLWLATNFNALVQFVKYYAFHKSAAAKAAASESAPE